jgi:hypothetical protein
MSKNDNEVPPGYAVNDRISSSAGPLVEELNSAFRSLNIADVPPAFPKVDHCLAHLKLLSTFHLLKIDIGYMVGLFNLWDARCERWRIKMRR